MNIWIDIYAYTRALFKNGTAVKILPYLQVSGISFSSLAVDFNSLTRHAYPDMLL